jgi:hypothetical protein
MQRVDFGGSELSQWCGIGRVLFVPASPFVVVPVGCENKNYSRIRAKIEQKTGRTNGKQIAKIMKIPIDSVEFLLAFEKSVYLTLLVGVL